MNGSYSFLQKRESEQRAYVEADKRRRWNEKLNMEIVKLTGQPFCDENPERTTLYYNDGVSAKAAAYEIVAVRPARDFKAEREAIIRLGSYFQGRGPQQAAKAVLHGSWFEPQNIAAAKLIAANRSFYSVYSVIRRNRGSRKTVA